MVDFRKFLDRKDTDVLPFVGGLTVRTADRRLPVREPVELGWWSFEIEGRIATATQPADPPDLSRLRAVRGHLVDGWLFWTGTSADRVLLRPEEESPQFAIVTARRWHSGDLLFDQVEFDDEATECARQAFLDRAATLEGIKGATPSLRAAFGFATLRRCGAQMGVSVSVREVLATAFEVALGRIAPEAVLTELVARDYQQTRGRGSLPMPTGPRSPSAGARRNRRGHTAQSEPPTVGNAGPRAAIVLENAGAHFLAARTLGQRNLEVIFRYLGEQFIAVVDWETLHVYDAGICLSGADEELGLDALPSVIAEAIEGDLLYITRRG